MQSKLYQLSLLVILGIIWGAGPTINKLVMTKGIDPISYTFWQFVGPGIILLIYTLLSGSLRLNYSHMKFYLLCAVVGLFIPSNVIHLCALHIPSSILPVIINTVPILVYFMALVAKQEQFNLVRFLGFLFGIIGVFIIIMPNSLSLLSWNWALFAMIAPVCFALNSLFIRPFRPKSTNPQTLATGMLLTSSLLMVPVVLWQGHLYFCTSNLQPKDFIMLVRMAMHSLGYILYFELIKTAGAVYYSMVSGVVIVTGFILAYYIHHETIDYYGIFAMVMIFISITILTKTQKNHA